MAKVSIVVRTKNRLSFLKRALADVAAQTFSDWDLLIINDAGDKAALDELYAGLDATLRAKITVWHLCRSISVAVPLHNTAWMRLRANILLCMMTMTPGIRISCSVVRVSLTAPPNLQL